MACMLARGNCQIRVRYHLASKITRCTRYLIFRSSRSTMGLRWWGTSTKMQRGRCFSLLTRATSCSVSILNSKLEIQPLLLRQPKAIWTAMLSRQRSTVTKELTLTINRRLTKRIARDLAINAYHKIGKGVSLKSLFYSNLQLLTMLLLPDSMTSQLWPRPQSAAQGVKILIHKLSHLLLPKARSLKYQDVLRCTKINSLWYTKDFLR